MGPKFGQLAMNAAHPERRSMTECDEAHTSPSWRPPAVLQAYALRRIHNDLFALLSRMDGAAIEEEPVEENHPAESAEVAETESRPTEQVSRLREHFEALFGGDSFAPSEIDDLGASASPRRNAA